MKTLFTNIWAAILFVAFDLGAINFIHAKDECILSIYCFPQKNQNLWHNWNRFPTTISSAEWNEMRLQYAKDFVAKNVRFRLGYVNRIEAASAAAARHFRWQIVNLFKDNFFIPRYARTSQKSAAIIESLKYERVKGFFACYIPDYENSLQILIDQLLVPLSEEVAQGVRNAYCASQFLYFGSLRIVTAANFKHVYDVARVAACAAVKAFLDCIKKNEETFVEQVLTNDLGVLLESEMILFFNEAGRSYLKNAANEAVSEFLQQDKTQLPDVSICAFM